MGTRERSKRCSIFLSAYRSRKFVSVYNWFLVKSSCERKYKIKLRTLNEYKECIVSVVKGHFHIDPPKNSIDCRDLKRFRVSMDLLLSASPVFAARETCSKSRVNSQA